MVRLHYLSLPDDLWVKLNFAGTSLRQTAASGFKQQLSLITGA
jgi:hypothetical protein